MPNTVTIPPVGSDAEAALVAKLAREMAISVHGTNGIGPDTLVTPFEPLRVPLPGGSGIQAISGIPLWKYYEPLARCATHMMRQEGRRDQ